MNSRLDAPCQVSKSAMLLLILTAATNSIAEAQQTEDRWAAFQPLVGKWKGTGQGPTGAPVQNVEWKFVLGGSLLQCTTSSQARGDHHQDIGLISYDTSRQKFIYRAFHSEGFVNQYVATISPDGTVIEFVSESIENGPPGLRAMETLQFKGTSLETTLRLATGDGPYKVCASAKLERDDSKAD